MMRTRAAWVTSTLIIASACSADRLGVEIGSLRIEALPTSGQTALTDPSVGIDVGSSPLLGSRRARFRLLNDSLARVQVNLPQIIETTAATGHVSVTRNAIADADADADTDTDTAPVTAWPVTLLAGQQLDVVVVLEALEDGAEALVVVAVPTNTGVTRNAAPRLRVVGIGQFIGEPRLEVAYYGGQALPRDADCNARVEDGRIVCALAPLDFGQVSFGTTASQAVMLRNAPLQGTCLLPPLPDGSVDCSRVCTLRVEPDPAAHALGLGILPEGSRFSIAGNAAVVPVEIAPPNVDCGDDGELRLLVSFAAGDALAEETATLVIETNAANAPVVEVPLRAAARQGPVAVARLVTCDAVAPGAPCVDPEAIRPLQSIYVDGSASYDPSRPGDGAAIVAYHWSVVDWPTAADASTVNIVNIRGDGGPTASIWLPTAGRYVLRLTVENDAGLRSGVGPTSDLEIVAINDNRLHVQLSWTTPDNDQDLHLIYAEVNDRVYHGRADCFWLNCQPLACSPEADCAPAQWDEAEEPFQGPNPRLDIDDTDGLGPENAHIDAPLPGRYRVFAHYYGLVGESDTATLTTVRIYTDGLLAAEYSRSLHRNDLWAVAQITWTDDGPGAITPAVSDATNQIGSVTSLDHLAYPDGAASGAVF